jgi:hypothetical protein
MGQLKSEENQANVNVTLGPSDRFHGELREKEFPCPLCGAGLPILISKRQKPYCTCNLCGVQIFVRGKAGIARLMEMANAGIQISVKTESASHGIHLLNRLEQLKLQREELKAKSGIIFTDENVENVIRLVDVEMEKVQGELARIAIKTESEANK